MCHHIQLPPSSLVGCHIICGSASWLGGTGPGEVDTDGFGTFHTQWCLWRGSSASGCCVASVKINACLLENREFEESHTELLVALRVTVLTSQDMSSFWPVLRKTEREQDTVAQTCNASCSGG